MRVNLGQIVSLIGANGAGKTTLLRSISGLVRPKTGRIEFEGKKIDRWPIDKIVRHGIVQVPEGRDIFTKLDVQQNLTLGSYTIHPRSSARQTQEKVLRYFPILKDRLGQLAGTLSGGEQQMLAIGRALMACPRLLLLDEPSQGLAPIVTQKIFDIIRAIKESGTTILLVEQNAFMALKSSSYAYVLQNGRVVLEDTASKLQENEMVRTHYLG